MDIFSHLKELAHFEVGKLSSMKFSILGKAAESSWDLQTYNERKCICLQFGKSLKNAKKPKAPSINTEQVIDWTISF